MNMAFQVVLDQGQAKMALAFLVISILFVMAVIVGWI